MGWDDNVHVPARTLARQPHHTRAGGGSLSLSLPGGPFWPLRSPNPPKRTSPAWSAWLSPLLSLWWSVSAAQQPNSFKTDLASLLCWAGAVLLALALVVRFGRSAAQIFQNGLRQLGLLGCPPCSPSGDPFRPLSSPTPSKRTSPACYAGLGLCSFGRSAARILQNGPTQLSWWSVLAAQQPESFKTDLPSSPTGWGCGGVGGGVGGVG